MIDKITEQSKKHKHYNVILAWAEGYEIQCLKGGGTGKAVWVDQPHPTFAPFLEYRAKPPVNKKVALMKEMEELLERMKKLESVLCT